MSGNPPPPSPSSSGNAFTGEFLERLQQRDEPIGAAEAELTGPWRIQKVKDGYALFRRWESAERGDSPFALFRRREDALLCFAILPGLAAHPAYSLVKDAAAEGFPIEGGGEALGSLRSYEPAVVASAATAAALVRSPLCLAALLDAAGSFSLASAGELLGGRSLAGIVGE